MNGIEVGELRARLSLDESDAALVRNKTGSTRLGFAVLLKFFEAERRFPSDRGDVPAEVIGFLASQIGVEYSAIVD